MPNTPNSPRFELADRVTGGVLAEKIRRYRDLGVSWTALSAILRDEHDLELNAETLRRWGQTICDDAPAGADSGSAA